MAAHWWHEIFRTRWWTEKRWDACHLRAMVLEYSQLSQHVYLQMFLKSGGCTATTGNRQCSRLPPPGVRELGLHSSQGPRHSLHDACRACSRREPSMQGHFACRRLSHVRWRSKATFFPNSRPHREWPCCIRRASLPYPSRLASPREPLPSLRFILRPIEQGQDQTDAFTSTAHSVILY